MQAVCREVDGHVEFVLSEVAPIYHFSVRELGYNEVAGEFRRTLPVSTPLLDRICHNFEQYVEEMILQTARIQTTPWERALNAFLDLVEPHQLDWWVGGSAAFAVRGLDVVPRDFDIVVGDRDAQKLGDILLEY